MKGIILGNLKYNHFFGGEIIALLIKLQWAIAKIMFFYLFMDL